MNDELAVLAQKIRDKRATEQERAEFLKGLNEILVVVKTELEKS